MTNMQEIERMTTYEYQLRMLACRLSRLDQECAAHAQAWVNRQIKATKGKKGEPYYKDFRSFFDFEQKEREILGLSVLDEQTDATAVDMLRKVNL